MLRTLVSKSGLHIVRAGNPAGRKIVFIPGALGTAMSDFSPQLNDPQLQAHFDLISFDPRGYGLSRPPNRSFSRTFYDDDAADAVEVADAVDAQSFTVAGWSDGANSAVIVAAKEPARIESVVMWGGNSTVEKEDLPSWQATEDIQKWSPRMRAPLEELYGIDLLQQMWSEWNRTMEELQRTDNGNVCRSHLTRVTCPVLLLHGDLDPMVTQSHVDRFRQGLTLAKSLQYVSYPAGKHNIHMRYASEFNRAVKDFLLSIPRIE